MDLDKGPTWDLSGTTYAPYGLSLWGPDAFCPYGFCKCHWYFLRCFDQYIKQNTFIRRLMFNTMSFTTVQLHPAQSHLTVRRGEEVTRGWSSGVSSCHPPCPEHLPTTSWLPPPLPSCRNSLWLGF